MRKPLFIDTVTVYNHYRLAREDAWARTVLRGVQYRTETVKTVSSSGVVSVAKSVSVTIPEGVDAGTKAYLAPATFARSEDKTGAWTINPSSDMDVIVLGEATQEVTEQYTMADLRKEHQGACATVKSVKDARGRLLPLWKVTAI